MKSISGNNFTWINIDSPSPEILNPLLNIYPFHPLDLEDCLSKTQLPKIEEYSDYLFIILHFPRFLKEKRFSIPAQVSIFLGKDFLITIHSGELKPINKLFQKCEVDADTCIEYMSKSPSFLLYKVLYALLENIMLMISRVISNLEDLEEEVFDENVDAVREITGLRHNIANLRRISFSLRRIIHELEKKLQKFAGEGIGIYLSDLADYIDKAWSILEECKETIEIYKDTDFIISADRTNKILALLTIIFTFTIPATVIGTFWGMNIYLPGGTEVGPWTFLGKYTTLIIIISASTIPALLMYIKFKKAKWL